MGNLDQEYKFKLSIITVNLNNKDGLQKTIESVISQTCKDFEWIIIDGGSVDGSKDIIEKYSKEIDYWVSESDQGIYHAMNKGILRSHGEYLLFLNSGDYLFDICPEGMEQVLLVAGELLPSCLTLHLQANTCTPQAPAELFLLCM